MPIGRGGGADPVPGEDDGGSGLVVADLDAVVPVGTEGAAAVELPATDTSEGWVFSG